jgi:hypothetical protein
MNQERFDDLAKGLASGTVSRGQALRWMGGALVGAALASVPGVAWAAPGGNSACVQFCKEVFPGPGRDECIGAAARGEGLCFECGPKATDPTRVLCGQVCCASGESCSANEQCVLPIPFCDPASTEPCGTSPSGTPAAGTNCFCRPLVEGGGFCATAQINFCSRGCNTNDDCPRGTFCTTDGRPLGFAGGCVSTCEAGNPGAACVCPDGRDTCSNVCCPTGQSCVFVGFTGTCQPDV